MLLILCVAVLAVFDTTHAGCSRAKADSSSRQSQDPDQPAAAQGPTPCPENTHFEECGASCSVTCENYQDPDRVCTERCLRGCACDKGLVRGPDYYCIPPEQCPAPDPPGPVQNQGPPAQGRRCGRNSHYEICGRSCPVTCYNYQDSTRTCTEDCKQGCRCNDGFVRDGNRCIKPDKCPPPVRKQGSASGTPDQGPTKDCSSNTHYESCGTACPDTCDNYRDTDRVCTQQCRPGCQCNKGLVFSTENGKCINPLQCPQRSNVASDSGTPDQGSNPDCPINQHYEDCGTACPDTCDNYRNKNRVCTRECRPGCQCNEGLVLSDGKCINPLQCPQQSGVGVSHGSTEYCGANQHYEDCGTACPLTCNNYYDPPSACSANCVYGCQCDDGYILDPYGNCVVPSQCPGDNRPVCPANERYNYCGSRCPVTCQNLRGGAPQSCSTECVEGCECANGFVRDTQSGYCVRPRDCPMSNTCPQNEYYSSCVNPCNDCQNRGICRDSYYCYYGCDCIQGYYRNANGRCVAAASCPNNCKKNEVFSNCRIPCNDCYNRGNCYYYCYNGCNCRSGYYNGPDGTCIPANQCPRARSG